MLGSRFSLFVARTAVWARRAAAAGAVLVAVVSAPTGVAIAAPAPVIDGGIDDVARELADSGTPLDTDAPILGDRTAPTTADVARAFDRLDWPSSLLPAPSALADERLRRYLAFVNLPSATTTTELVGVPVAAQAARRSAPSGRRAHASQTQLQVIYCAASMTTNNVGSTSQAIGLFNCPLPVTWTITWTWFSLYTGSIIQGPWSASSKPWEPVYSKLSDSTTTRGTVGHRSVHWIVSLCPYAGGSCGSGTLIAHT